MSIRQKWTILRNFVLNLKTKDFPILITYTIIFIFSFTLLLAFRKNLYLCNNNGNILYLLSSISQVLATILALVFSVVLVITQFLSKYSEKIYRRVFNLDVILFIFLFIISIVFSLFLLLLSHSEIPVIICASLSFACIISILILFILLKKRLDLNKVVIEITDEVLDSYRKGEDFNLEAVVLYEILDTAYKNENKSILKTCILQLLRFCKQINETYLQTKNVLEPSEIEKAVRFRKRRKEMSDCYMKIESIVLREDPQENSIDLLLNEYSNIADSKYRILSDFILNTFIHLIYKLERTRLEEDPERIEKAIFVLNSAIKINSRARRLDEASYILASQSELVISLIINTSVEILEKNIGIFISYLSNLGDVCCSSLLLNERIKIDILRWLWILGSFTKSKLKNYHEIASTEFKKVLSLAKLETSNFNEAYIRKEIDKYLSIYPAEDISGLINHLSDKYIRDELKNAYRGAEEYISLMYPNYLSPLRTLSDDLKRFYP